MTEIPGLRLPEARLSTIIRTNLQRRGLWTLKTNERVRRGVPDIYATGGLWIESKVIASYPTLRNYPLRYFTGMQRITLDTLTKKGDRCFTAIVWYGDHNRSFLMMPWYEFRRVRIWDVYTLAHFSQPYLGPANLDLDWFGWDGPAFNYDRWKRERFYDWSGAASLRHYVADLEPDVTEELEGLTENGPEDSEHLPGEAASPG